MDLKAHRVGGQVTYLPRINGNRDLPLTERIECELLPMSNAERESFGARMLPGANARRDDMISNVVAAISDVLTARVVVVRGLTVAGREVKSGAELVKLKAEFNSPDLSSLIEELLSAVQDLSVLEPGLQKN